MIIVADGLMGIWNICARYTNCCSKKIMKRGTNIIAVALDDTDSFDCYDTLREIYPKIISCNDLKRLTGQLLAVVSKQLQ